MKLTASFHMPDIGSNSVVSWRNGCIAVLFSQRYTLVARASTYAIRARTESNQPFKCFFLFRSADLPLLHRRFTFLSGNLRTLESDRTEVKARRCSYQIMYRHMYHTHQSRYTHVIEITLLTGSPETGVLVLQNMCYGCGRSKHGGMGRDLHHHWCRKSFPGVV